MGTVVVGSSELCEAYISRRGTFLYSVATFPSPLQCMRIVGAEMELDRVCPLAASFGPLHERTTLQQ